MKWLTHNVSAALSALGGTWEQQFARLETFHRLYGHCEVPSNPAFLVATHCQRLRQESNDADDGDEVRSGGRWTLANTFSTTLTTNLSERRRCVTCSGGVGSSDVTSSPWGPELNYTRSATRGLIGLGSFGTPRSAAGRRCSLSSRPFGHGSATRMCPTTSQIYRHHRQGIRRWRRRRAKMQGRGNEVGGLKVEQ